MKTARQESVFTQIADGVMAEVISRPDRIPPHLNSASHEGRMAACPCPTLLGVMRVTQRFPVRSYGTRLACRDLHDYTPLLAGVYAGLELRLDTCRYCGAVEVRDVSLDILPGIKAGRGKPRRRSDVLGWYSGRRSLGRTYR